MPVFRHRTREEAARVKWIDPGDTRLGERLRQIYHTGERLWPLARPPGVWKFRTLADAAAWRASWPRAPRQGGG